MVRQNSPKNASNIEKAADYSGYSKEDLLKLIDLEMAKPEKKIDGDLVDAYVKAALLKDQDTLPGYEAKMPQPGSRVIKLNSARRKRKKRAVIALAACISVLVVVFLTPISSYAFNFSIIDTLATWYRDKVTVKSGNMTSSQSSVQNEDEVHNALAEQGITDILLPHYQMDKYSISLSKINPNDISTDINIQYLDNEGKIKINCFISIFSSQIAMDDVNLQGRYPAGIEKDINGRKILLISSKDVTRVVFTDALTHYDIICNFGMEATEKLVETIY